MNNNVTKIQLWVFKIWFMSLFCVLVVYASKYLGVGPVRPPFESLFQSLQMMTGLLVPQIAIMVSFYLNFESQKPKIKRCAPEQITVIVWLSISYHLILISSVVAGIGFGVFDDVPDGDMLQGNSAAILAIMGLFSLFVTPVVFLFSKQDA